jgi:hypothetical protein
LFSLLMSGSDLQNLFSLMSEIKPLPVDDLNLDLHNYRTVAQKNEAASVHALISIDPAYFWALTESLVEDGWHGTENVIVLRQDGKTGPKFSIREGNRRVGALKLVLGMIPMSGFAIPSDLEEKMAKVTDAWKKANSVVPCNIFAPTEAAQAQRLVGLTHAKGEKAGRLAWNAVARARYNRDVAAGSEPALDLLESYLKSGQNLNAIQKERWGGEYPLSVLAETLKRLAPRLAANDSREAAAQYPGHVKYRASFENILHDIGVDTLGFPGLRNAAEDFGLKYGFPATSPVSGPGSTASTGGGSGGTGAAASSANTAAGGNTSATATAGSTKRGPNAVASNDPRSVTRALKKFTPKGQGREKLVRLLVEARSLKLKKHPHAFCFLLRSMFELSAKCYCDDKLASGGPSPQKTDGTDKPLVEVLKEISGHLTKGGKNKLMMKELHGATAELAKPEGFLSVTSMNQLVHNKRFSVDETHISTLFHNIFSLIEAMNR